MQTSLMTATLLALLAGALPALPALSAPPLPGTAAGLRTPADTVIRAAGADSARTWTLGALTIAAPYARATLPGAPVAGGFLTIANDGPGDDRLVAAQSPAAGRVEVHEMAIRGDVMKMRELADGLPLPAGQTVELRPGGYHLMFMELRAPLVEGDTVEVTLTFERAGSITLPLAVGPATMRRQGGTGQGHGMTGQ